MTTAYEEVKRLEAELEKARERAYGEVTLVQLTAVKNDISFDIGSQWMLPLGVGQADVLGYMVSYKCPDGTLGKVWVPARAFDPSELDLSWRDMGNVTNGKTPSS